MQIAWEGCISQNDQIYLIERPAHIKCEFWTLETVRKIHSFEKEIEEDVCPETGELIEIEKWVAKDKKKSTLAPTNLYVRGLLSRAVQHEIDHLDGKIIWESEDIKILDSQPTSELVDPERFGEFMEKNKDKMLVY